MLDSFSPDFVPHTGKHAITKRTPTTPNHPRPLVILHLPCGRFWVPYPRGRANRVFVKKHKDPSFLYVHGNPERSTQKPVSRKEPSDSMVEVALREKEKQKKKQRGEWRENEPALQAAMRTTALMSEDRPLMPI